VFNQQLLSNLIRFKKDSVSVIEGDTAESWELGADGKTYTFKLRKDVLWSDGKPFTSADVLYNFQRAADPKFVFNKERVDPIAVMEAPDPFTFKVILKTVSASFLPNIAGPFMLMYPAHVSDMAAWQRSPVGSGPFLFKQYNKGASQVFTKNPGYYGKDAVGRRLPYLDEIVYHIIGEPTLGLAAFRTGRLHCGCGYDSDFLPDAEEQLRKEIAGVKLELTFGSVHALLFNLRRPSFNNLAFRQALAVGFDKEKVAAVARQGKNYRPMPPLFPPELGGQWGLPKSELIKIPGYNPDHSADLAIARQKFQESGIDPRDVSLQVLGSASVRTATELVATVLSELGVKAVPFVPELAELTRRRTAGDFDILYFLVGLSLDDPADQYASVLQRDGSRNFGRYISDRVDRLLRDQDAELDPVKRRALLWEVQRIHLAEFPTVPFLSQGGAFGTRPEVFGYIPPKLSATSAFRLEEIWLEPAL